MAQGAIKMKQTLLTSVGTAALITAGQIGGANAVPVFYNFTDVGDQQITTATVNTHGVFRRETSTTTGSGQGAFLRISRTGPSEGPEQGYNSSATPSDLEFETVNGITKAIRVNELIESPADSNAFRFRLDINESSSGAGTTSDTSFISLDRVLVLLDSVGDNDKDTEVASTIPNPGTGIFNGDTVGTQVANTYWGKSITPIYSTGQRRDVVFLLDADDGTAGSNDFELTGPRSGTCRARPVASWPG